MPIVGFGPVGGAMRRPGGLTAITAWPVKDGVRLTTR